MTDQKKVYETPKVDPVKPDSVSTRDEQLIAATAKALMNEMIPAMIALQGAGKSPAAAVASAPDLGTCQACGQRLAGCKGEHEKMVVYPAKFPQYAEYFQGRFINGVRYLSNGPDHEITVPRSSVGDISYAIRVAEEEEVAARTKRTKQHNSGDVSNPHAANTPGFR